MPNRGCWGTYRDADRFPELLSYARHDYFRRILCDFVGEMAEKEEYPQDWAALTEIVEGVCWKNAKEYFGF